MRVNDLDKSYISALCKGIVATIVVIFSFFIPLDIVDQKGTTLFGFTISFLVKVTGAFLSWIILFIMYSSFFAFIIGRVLRWSAPLKQYYSHEHPLTWILYLLGCIFMTLYHFQIGPEWALDEGISGTVIGAIVFQVFFIILIGGVLLPLIIFYGSADFVGTLIEPLMRPLFKVPGRASIDAVTSFVTSSSLAVYLTSTFYKQNLYTRREAAIIATSFSAVSIGFASLAVGTLNMLADFNLIYFSSLGIAFIIAMIVARIPPLSRIPDTYFDGSDKKIDGTESEKTISNLLRRAIDNVVVRVQSTPCFVEVLRNSVLESLMLIPKIIPLLCAVGIGGLLIAEYTPLFQWLGYVVKPLLYLLQMPDIDSIAPAILIGFCEMYLPVLLVAEQDISDQARFFVLITALVQIIFLSETVVVMLSTKIPLKFWQIGVIFLQRTFIAIPIVALFSHIVY